VEVFSAFDEGVTLSSWIAVAVVAASGALSASRSEWIL
jgi:hypothetical protein